MPVLRNILYLAQAVLVECPGVFLGAGSDELLIVVHPKEAVDPVIPFGVG